VTKIDAVALGAGEHLCTDRYRPRRLRSLVWMLWGTTSYHENTLPSPMRIYLCRMQWPGYLRLLRHTRNWNSTRDQHQADRLDLFIMRQALRFAADFTRGRSHCTYRMEAGGHCPKKRRLELRGIVNPV